MAQDNHFVYQKSRHLDQVTLLQASMSDFTYGKHAHEEYSFGITLTGRQDFFSRGENHRSTPGKIMVFNPGQVHDGHSGLKSPLHYRMLYIHPEQLEPMLAVAGVKHHRDFQVQETLFDDAPIRQHILNLAQLIEQPAPDQLQHECELYQLAAAIAHRYGQHRPDSSKRKVDQLLLRAKEYIHAHLLDDTSLDQISQHANLSKYHFLRLFREQFGMTPHQYIINCRVNRAREALEQGAALDDVVFDYGFADLSHFNRRFKPIFGTTPKRYQQLLLNN